MGLGEIFCDLGEVGGGLVELALGAFWVAAEIVGVFELDQGFAHGHQAREGAGDEVQFVLELGGVDVGAVGAVFGVGFDCDEFEGGLGDVGDALEVREVGAGGGGLG